MSFQPSSAGTRYLFGFASVVVVTLVHVVLSRELGLDAGLAPHAVAIAATAWCAGAGPAVLAVLLSLAYGLYAPTGPPLADTRTLAACALWLLCGFALTYVMLALRRRRDLDAFALHASADAVIVTDVRGRITEMNPVARALIAADAIDAEQRSATLGAELAALAAASSLPRWEFVREHPHGGSCIFAVTASHIGPRVRGRTVFVLHDITDSTARNRAAVATPTFEHLQSIVDASDARMFHVDRQFRLTWSNRALRERHGIADGTGAEVSTLFDAQKRAALLRPLQRAMGGHPETLEWRALDERGQPVWTFTMITPDVDAKGEVRGCFVLCVDAAAWHGADIIRQRSEDQRRGVLESLPDLVWMATADGTGHWFNHRWAAYTGRSVTDWTDPMPADDRERAAGAWQLAKAQGLPLAVECRLRRDDGVLRWHLVRMQPLRESVTDSAIWGWCGSCTDIDDRKQAEVSLRTTQQRIGAFLGTLSHELRNPLAALSAAIQIVRHPRAAPAMAARAMDTLERQSALLARMVEELLDAARLMDGRIDLQRRCVVLNHLLREVCEDLSPRAAERGVDLHCEIPDRTILVDADMLRIKQAVENLAINALDACAAGQTVTISTIDGDAGEVGIRVADTGCGLPAESLATLFDVGSAARHDKGGSAGLGLGLKAVKRIMQLHGGRIVAASTGLGEGSTFDLFLPLHDAHGAAAAAEHDQSRDNLLRGQRILIIGDAGIADDTLRVQIERCGAEHVRVAKNGFDGLRLLTSLQPTVLVCGLDLPAPLSGYDVLREVTRLAENRPRLVAIGDDDTTDLAEARAAGFDDCLIKPITLTRLLGALAHARAFPTAVA
jgi:PAS domain S-box-containing protein